MSVATQPAEINYQGISVELELHGSMLCRPIYAKIQVRISTELQPHANRRRPSLHHRDMELLRVGIQEET